MSKLTPGFNTADIPDLQTSSGGKRPLAGLLNTDIDNIDKELEIQPSWQAVIGFSHAFAESKVSGCARRLSMRLLLLAVLKPGDGSVEREGN